jgi:hypothetical protein
VDFLRDWLEIDQAKLQTAEGVELNRAQGRAQVLSRILGMAKELREYGDRKIENELKKEGVKNAVG